MYFHANQKGLLDPDSYSQSYSDMQPKFSTGQTLAGNTWWMCQTMYNTTKNSSGVLHSSKANKVKATGVSGADGYVFIPISGENNVTSGFKPDGDAGKYAIGSQCKDPERCMQIINYLYSPEGIEDTNGPEGLVWKYNTKTKKDELTAYGEQAHDEVKAKTLKVSDTYGGGTFSSSSAQWGSNGVSSSENDPNTKEPYNYLYWSSYEKKHSYSDLIKDWSSKIGQGTMNSMDYLRKVKTLAVQPGVSVKQDPDLSSLNNDKKSLVQNVVKQYSWRCMMSTTTADFNSNWNAMVSKAKSCGLSAVDNAYMAQYKLYKKACYNALHNK
jgi:putative aldouronate transport system substrate-binding protein